jgi:putative nucleotidyltransferase with HDIG domain
MPKSVRITIDLLKVGHYVSSLDLSWLDTPFLTHRFHIRSMEDIHKLRNAGVLSLFIDPERSTVDKLPEEPSPQNQILASPENTSIDCQEVLPDRIIRSVGEIHRHMVVLFKKFFREARNNDVMIDMSPIKFAMDRVIEVSLNYPEALLLISSLQEEDDEIYFHSVNTMFLAFYLAWKLDKSFDETVIWGLSGLLHDIGKVRIDPYVLHKPGALQPHEWEIIRNHPQWGADIIRRQTSLPPIVSRVAMEHHCRMDDTGYPDHLLFESTEALSKIISVLDIYDALTSDRSYRKGHPLPKALKILVEMSQGKIDPYWVAAFIHAVGVYPIGSILEIDEGEVGVVVERTSPGEPDSIGDTFRLAILRDKNKFPTRKAEFRSFSWNPSRKAPVSSSYNHAEWGVDWEIVSDVFQSLTRRKTSC